MNIDKQDKGFRPIGPVTYRCLKKGARKRKSCERPQHPFGCVLQTLITSESFFGSGGFFVINKNRAKIFWMKKDPQIIVVSVGGSLIVPDRIDENFLKEFKKFILKYLNKGFRFAIIAGGGKTARNYQKVASDVTSLTKTDIDWIGIHSTRLNAHLLRAIFYKESHPKIIKNPNEVKRFKEKIIIASGWKPGCSTDYDAVLVAKNLKAKKLVNLSNIDSVYDKDPRKFKSAKKIEEINWKDFRKIIPKKWDPGLSSPFDPVASREAEKLGMEVAIMNGSDLDNFGRYLDGKEFGGTKITNK